LSFGATWTTLVQIAVVGTQRDGVQIPAAPPDFDMLGNAAPQTTEDAVLRLAGMLGVARRAGASVLEDSATPVAASPADSLPRCGAAAASDLGRILSSDLELLPEWLHLANEARQRIPEALLPTVFERARGRRAFHDAVTTAAGARGRWLARYNPEWNVFAGVADDAEQQWRTGTGAARVAAFVAMRAHDPVGARQLLEQSWDEQSASERAEFVGGMRPHVSDDDEPFLETLLDDRSKAVRERAMAVLAYLPNSRFAARARGLVQGVASIRSGVFGKKLDIVLPQDADDAMRRDGIDAGGSGTSTDTSMGGPRACLLRRIVERVPPAHFSQTIAPRHVLDLAADSEHANAFIAGVMEAAVTYGDDGWRAACIDFLCERHEFMRWATPAGLVGAAPQPQRDALVRAMRRGRATALTFLHHVPAPWDPALSAAAADLMRTLFATAGDDAEWTRRRALLLEASRRLDVGVPGLAQGWPEPFGVERTRDAPALFGATIDFRAAMRAHLKAER
jgi:hypothetical protein